jgi:hypothetical protein
MNSRDELYKTFDDVKYRYTVVEKALDSLTDEKDLQKRANQLNLINQYHQETLSLLASTDVSKAWTPEEEDDLNRKKRNLNRARRNLRRLEKELEKKKLTSPEKELKEEGPKKDTDIPKLKRKIQW